MLKYDEVLNRQRQVIYGERREVLEGADLHEQVRKMIDEVVEGYVTGATTEGFPEEWDLDKLWQAFRQLYPVRLTQDELIELAGGERAGLTSEFITEQFKADAHAAYDRREEEVTPDTMRELERQVVLSVLDRKWQDHLYEMDYLQEGISLRAYSQRDPLVEFQREGFEMFNAMLDAIREESVGYLFNLKVEVQDNPIVEETPARGTGQASAPDLIVGAAQAGAKGGGAGRGGTTTGPRAPGAAAGRARGAAAAGGRTRASGASAAAGSGRAASPEAPAAAAGVALPPGLAKPKRPAHLEYSAPTIDGAGDGVEHRAESADGGDFARVGRNEPCPCGSGRKFKRCHGDPRTRAAAT